MGPAPSPGPIGAATKSRGGDGQNFSDRTGYAPRSRLWPGLDLPLHGRRVPSDGACYVTMPRNPVAGGSLAGIFPAVTGPNQKAKLGRLCRGGFACHELRNPRSRQKRSRPLPRSAVREVSSLLESAPRDVGEADRQGLEFRPVLAKMAFLAKAPILGCF